MGGRFLSLCEAMSRASRRGCPPQSWRRDCTASSPNTPLRVPTVGRILAEAVVLSIQDRVPNPQSLDHLGVMIHPINHDIGRHGRQFAPARPSAGHDPSTANQGTPLDVDAALPLSTKSHIGIVDDEGERVVATGTVHLRRLLSGSGVVAGTSRDQAGDEGVKQGFAASARVVHELKEAEVERQLVLRDTPMRAQPGAQQRPEPLHRVDVDLAKAVAVLVTGILAAGVADRLVLVAPGWQAGVDAILVCVDEGARGDGGGDDRHDRALPHVGQQAQHDLAAALDQPEDGRLVLRQRTAARRACQLAPAPEPARLATAAGCPLCPATT